MKKSIVKANIVRAEIKELTHESIKNFQDDVKTMGLGKEDVKDSLIKHMVSKESWDFQKSTNFVNLFEALLDSTPYRPPQHEKVLRFPSQESEKQLKYYLSLAQISIKICMYTFTNRQLMECMRDAKNRGVRVQLITDKESLSTLYIHEMAAIGIECTHHNLSNTAKMHHKFAVVDNLILINGSLNWTMRGVRQNHENVMISGSQVYINEFLEEFESLWGNYAHNILSQADSAFKVKKEKEYLEKKRDLKEKEKRSHRILKQANKLLDSFNAAKLQ